VAERREANLKKEENPRGDHKKKPDENKETEKQRRSTPNHRRGDTNLRRSPKGSIEGRR
jgi:hypothetical protein